MSDLKGVGGSSAAHFYGSNSSQDRVTTVKVGEHTLADVARRLGNGVTEEALRKENPHIKNSVQPGQDIRLPPRDEVKSSKPKTAVGPKKEEPEKTEPKKAEPKKDGFKVPEIKIGKDWKVPVPKPTPSTDDTLDRGGTSSNRKDDQERLDRTRPRDERDLDPKQIKEIKEKNLEPHKKVVDRELNKGMKEAEKKEAEKAKEREQRDEMIRNQKARVPR